MQVSDILETKGDRVVSIDTSATVSAVASTLNRERIGAVLVKEEGGGLAGIISERDIVRSLTAHGPAALDRPASDFMTQSLVTCAPDSSTEDVMTQMLESQIRHLPVVRDGALVGIISVSDVVKAVLSELRWMTKVLQDQVVAAAGWSTDED
jgi:CBS domain-containing protein